MHDEQVGANYGYTCVSLKSSLASKQLPHAGRPSYGFADHPRQEDGVACKAPSQSSLKGDHPGNPPRLCGDSIPAFGGRPGRPSSDPQPPLEPAAKVKRFHEADVDKSGVLSLIELLQHPVLQLLVCSRGFREPEILHGQRT